MTEVLQEGAGLLVRLPSHKFTILIVLHGSALINTSQKCAVSA